MMDRCAEFAVATDADWGGRLGGGRPRFVRRRDVARPTSFAFWDFNAAGSRANNTLCRGYLGRLAGYCDLRHLLEPTLLRARFQRFLVAVGLVVFSEIAEEDRLLAAWRHGS
jgi:hypothetical protein